MLLKIMVVRRAILGIIVAKKGSTALSFLFSLFEAWLISVV
jgi:hypothetical protein